MCAFLKSNKRIIKNDKYYYKNNDINKNTLPIIESINYSEILYIYDIININDISKMDLTRIPIINIILNCWIKINFDKLIDNKAYLYKIYINIIKINNLFDNIKNIDDIVKEYIDYWIDNFKIDDMIIKIQLLDDLILYIKKKNLNNNNE